MVRGLIRMPMNMPYIDISSISWKRSILKNGSQFEKVHTLTD